MQGGTTGCHRTGGAPPAAWAGHSQATRPVAATSFGFCLLSPQKGIKQRLNYIECQRGQRPVAESLSAGSQWHCLAGPRPNHFCSRTAPLERGQPSRHPKTLALLLELVRLHCSLQWVFMLKSMQQEH